MKSINASVSYFSQEKITDLTNKIESQARAIRNISTDFYSEEQEVKAELKALADTIKVMQKSFEINVETNVYDYDMEEMGDVSTLSENITSQFSNKTKSDGDMVVPEVRELTKRNLKSGSSNDTIKVIQDRLQRLEAAVKNYEDSISNISSNAGSQLNHFINATKTSVSRQIDTRLQQETQNGSLSFFTDMKDLK